MNLRENFRLAASSLNANKLRSLLTLLGIIIGIMAVIVIMTLSAGLQKQVMSSIEGVGATRHMVTVHERDDSTANDDPFAYLGSTPPSDDEDRVTLEQLDELRAHFGTQVQGVDVSNAHAMQAEMAYGSTQGAATLNPVVADSFVMRDLNVEYGRALTSDDVDRQRPLAVVSAELVDTLFDANAQAALGERIDFTVDSQTAVFTIVGVLEQKNTAPFGGGGGANAPVEVYIPVTAADRLGQPVTSVTEFSVQTVGDVDTAAFQSELQSYVDRWYQRNDNYEITVLDLSQSMEQLTSVFGIIARVLAAIGGISLLVGGIGVMNIMLITVTERTREIGVRKALGATQNDIRSQFIVESMLVCLIGGVIGVILGGAIGMIATASFDAFVYPPLGAVLVSLLFSLATGIFFGAYPASKAAKMQPIDALRYE
ncbi:ABC transporter permease [Corynebacterium sp.]|uniref:ABC transporter permease n=1 Tax=Corynebacterium sp. TaxID=1720 RepID=UPI002A919F41|nr:ABC transporter permease [Corynebacterium sp.]MDY5786198.1 ABC transporter permease [Corynebacterium sp.]